MSEQRIIQGDSLDKLKELADESIDLLCTDPPYGYSFMGKSWDKTLPDIGIFKECLRVLKPGSFAFVMSAPRSDVCARMMLMLEDAGFEIGFTPIYWTYASGFPKAGNIGKLVDKRLGVEREVKGTYDPRSSIDGSSRTAREIGGQQVTRSQSQVPITEATSDEAKALDGSYGGFQPKPAVEVIIVAMKPLSEKTFVDQALKNGKGITWLDNARIPTQDVFDIRAYHDHKDTFAMYENKGKGTREKYDVKPPDTGGRFPANLLVSDDVLNDGVDKKTHGGGKKSLGTFFGNELSESDMQRIHKFNGDSGSYSRYFDLDAWAQTLPFLAVPKASKSEKNAGLTDFEEKNASWKDDTRLNKHATRQPTKNNHPTVKPLKLMSYLITLGSRKGDTVLDPFVGSGTTVIAAKQLGRNAIGIEREKEYVEIAEARLKAVPDALF